MHSEDFEMANFCRRTAVAYKRGVPPCGPLLPENAVFTWGPEFRNFLLTKGTEVHLISLKYPVINCERAAMEAPPFSYKLERTRRAILQEIGQKYRR